MFVLEVVLGAVGGDLAIGTVIVRSLGFVFGAAVGGHAADRIDHRLRSSRPQVAEPVAGANGRTALLEVDDLTMHYRTTDGWVSAVDHVSFELQKGQALGLVGDTEELLADPQHPYTKALLASVPVPDPTYRRPDAEIEGGISKAINPPPVCRFIERCPIPADICHSSVHPPLEEVRTDHLVSCYRAEKGGPN